MAILSAVHWETQHFHRQSSALYDIYFQTKQCQLNSQSTQVYCSSQLFPGLLKLSTRLLIDSGIGRHNEWTIRFIDYKLWSSLNSPRTRSFHVPNLARFGCSLASHE